MGLGLAALALIERAGSDTGGVSSAVGVSRAAVSARAGGGGVPGDRLRNPAYQLGGTRGILADLRRAQREQSPLQRALGMGLPVEGTANDPGRVRRG